MERSLESESSLLTFVALLLDEPASKPPPSNAPIFKRQNRIISYCRQAAL
jgi:hypothetical protein